MSRSRSRSRRNYTEEFSCLEDFDIIKELGKGGYSVVYLVQHIDTGKRYALKCAMKMKKGKDRTKRLRQEITALEDLNHKRIIGLRGWFEDDEQIYLVLQYISGRDLSKFFKKQLPSRKTTADIILQIIDALKYCHDNNIIHRDMKLENILITKDLKIKLTDFGLCGVKSGNKLFYDEVGTARYTAPELLLKKGYDESIDVWGIGVILFMLLTGKYPFDGSCKESIFKRILHKNIDYSKYNLNTDEIHLLKRLLCKDPRYRIQLDDISKHQWFIKYH